MERFSSTNISHQEIEYIKFRQMNDSLIRATETTDTSAYNRSNAKASLVDLDAARAHVVREFPCIKE